MSCTRTDGSVELGGATTHYHTIPLCRARTQEREERGRLERGVGSLSVKQSNNAQMARRKEFKKTRGTLIKQARKADQHKRLMPGCLVFSSFVLFFLLVASSRLVQKQQSTTQSPFPSIQSINLYTPRLCTTAYPVFHVTHKNSTTPLNQSSFSRLVPLRRRRVVRSSSRRIPGPRLRRLGLRRLLLPLQQGRVLVVVHDTPTQHPGACDGRLEVVLLFLCRRRRRMAGLLALALYIGVGVYVWRIDFKQSTSYISSIKGYTYIYVRQEEPHIPIPITHHPAAPPPPPPPPRRRAPPWTARCRDQPPQTLPSPVRISGPCVLCVRAGLEG